MVLLFCIDHIFAACELDHMTQGGIWYPRVCTIYNTTKAKRDSHAVWWCAVRTTIGVSMERVFGVTVQTRLNHSRVPYPL